MGVEWPTNLKDWVLLPLSHWANTLACVRVNHWWFRRNSRCFWTVAIAQVLSCNGNAKVLAYYGWARNPRIAEVIDPDELRYQIAWSKGLSWVQRSHHSNSIATNLNQGAAQHTRSTAAAHHSSCKQLITQVQPQHWQLITQVPPQQEVTTTRNQPSSGSCGRGKAMPMKNTHPGPSKQSCKLLNCLISIVQ